VSSTWSGQQDPAWQKCRNADRAPSVVEHYDIDREPHADGVHRSAARQHQCGPAIEIVAIE